MVVEATAVLSAEVPKGTSGRRLPRRDYVILPALSLLTVLSMFVFAEIGARLFWTDEQTNPCLVHTSTVGDRYKPNCTSRTKLAEGPWVINHYNECGYRSAASCGPKPPGTIRIAVLGSSAADGFMVPYEKTFAGLVEQGLTQACRRPVEIQNLGVTGIRLLEEAHRVDEALELKPDLVILVLTPNDVWQDISPEQWEERQRLGSHPAGPDENMGLRQMSSLARFRDAIQRRMNQSRAMLVTRHYLYQNQRLYLRMYLTTHGDEADYLRVPYTDRWRKRMNDLDVLLGGMAAKLRSRDTPFAVVPSLFRVQASLLSDRDEFPGTDPDAFEREVAQIAAGHEMLVFDPNADYARLTHSEQMFYLVNGHANDKGQAILANSVIQQILSSSVLATCRAGAGPR